jgi:predicted RNA polymerase sigma factor
MQRWWLGGDPVAGKDLLSHYHTAFMHRCYERGVLAEEHMTRAFRGAVKALVEGYPADPIPEFEKVWLPFVDRGVDAVRAREQQLQALGRERLVVGDQDSKRRFIHSSDPAA